MGVMPCERAGCGNILCDVLIDNRYVCGECLHEFRESLDGASLPDRHMLREFRGFMTRPKDGTTAIVDVDEFIRTRNRGR